MNKNKTCPFMADLIFMSLQLINYEDKADKNHYVTVNFPEWKENQIRVITTMKSA